MKSPLLFSPHIKAISAWLVDICATTPRLAGFYYSFVRKSYQRDQQAFLSGRSAYEISLKAPKGTMTQLRRNVHRLEKGMVMRPQRLPFGLNYIKETVHAYKTALEHAIDPTELSWATGVLDEYFRLHSDVHKLNELRNKYCTAKNRFHTSDTLIPYRRNLTNPPPIDNVALMQLAKRRRSVRWFQSKPVPREKIERAIEIGSQAPSACNRQPFVFHIIDEPDLVKEVLSIPFGAAGFSHNVPTVAVVIGQQRHFFNERDRHLIYTDASLAIMGTILALETMDISSCCLNWPDIAEKESQMAKLLHLSTDERPVMLLAIGYPDPDGLVPYSQKKSLSQLTRYNLT